MEIKKGRKLINVGSGHRLQLNRLVQVDEGVPVADGGTPVPIEDYAYDGEGNRLASHLSALYLSNDHNQLLEDSTYTYTYDAKGNRVSRTAKVGGLPYQRLADGPEPCAERGAG